MTQSSFVQKIIPLNFCLIVTLRALHGSVLQTDWNFFLELHRCQQCPRYLCRNFPENRESKRECSKQSNQITGIRNSGN